MPLDEHGIPILTDIVQYGNPVQRTAPDGQVRLEGKSTAEIIDMMLASGSFKQQLDNMAAALTLNARQQIEQMLRPVIEQAIKQDLNHGGHEAYKVIRQRLEAALPDLVAGTKREESGKS